jgi:hypothetical protein
MALASIALIDIFQQPAGPFLVHPEISRTSSRKPEPVCTPFALHLL